MPTLETSIDLKSAGFAANRDRMLAAVDEFRNIEAKVDAMAASKHERYAARGMLLPRERLNLLLDPGSPFLELSSLAGYMKHDDKDGTGAGAGAIAGIGYVSQVRCLVIVDNFAVKGGTITPTGLHKKLRLQDIAGENKLPIVSLSQSGGANLTYAAEIFVSGGSFPVRSCAIPEVAGGSTPRLSSVGWPRASDMRGAIGSPTIHRPRSRIGSTVTGVAVRRVSAILSSGVRMACLPINWPWWSMTLGCGSTRSCGATICSPQRCVSACSSALWICRCRASAMSRCFVGPMDSDCPSVTTAPLCANCESVVSRAARSSVSWRTRSA